MSDTDSVTNSDGKGEEGVSCGQCRTSRLRIAWLIYGGSDLMDAREWDWSSGSSDEGRVSASPISSSQEPYAFIAKLDLTRAHGIRGLAKGETELQLHLACRQQSTWIVRVTITSSSLFYEAGEQLQWQQQPALSNRDPEILSWKATDFGVIVNGSKLHISGQSVIYSCTPGAGSELVSRTTM